MEPWLVQPVDLQNGDVITVKDIDGQIRHYLVAQVIRIDHVVALNCWADPTEAE